MDNDKLVVKEVGSHVGTDVANRNDAAVNHEFAVVQRHEDVSQDQ